MPELPEVETIRRQLAPLVEGRTLERLTIDDPRWCAPLAPDEVVAAVEGRPVEQLGRRGKYLIWTFAEDIHLLVHLRMTGTLLYDPPPGTPYARVRFDVGGGHHLLFCDPRRFGTGELAIGADALDAFLDARLGVEPLSDGFTGERLRALATGRRAPIKAFLLDQTKIAGVGNIYADEALFRARIHPLRPAGPADPRAGRRPARRGRRVLEAGSTRAARRSTTSATPTACRAPSRTSSSSTAAAASRARVRRAVVKFVAAGRGTYACESCQKPPRGARRGALQR
jgi:formamidopyrimidine-DNA glycosylase